MNNLPEFVGDQTPKVFDENSAIHYTHRFLNGKGVAMSIGRVYLKDAKKYKNIEDILSDVSLLPMDKKSYSKDELKCHVSQDALVPFPKFFDEFSILAHTSHSPIDRPIAFINHPDGAYYVASPEISKQIRRVPVSRKAEGTV